MVGGVNLNIENVLKTLISNDVYCEDIISEDDINELKQYKLLFLLFKNKHLFKLTENFEIKTLEKVNYNFMRNTILLKNLVQIDYELFNSDVKRCWLKGGSNLLQSTEDIKYRQLSDLDVFVDNSEKTKDILYSMGYLDGGYDLNGNYISLNENEIADYEKEHYELFAKSKVDYLDFSTIGDSEKFFKVYSSDKGIFTDTMIDIHKELTFDVCPEHTLKKKEICPVMDKVDEYWYLANKYYYECIADKSKNLQTLVYLIRLHNILSDKEKNKAKENINKLGFYREEVFEEIEKISNMDFSNIKHNWNN